MGQGLVGRVIKTIIKPLKDINVENRAMKVISKSKPSAAPKYPSDVTQLERQRKEFPELQQQLTAKDPSLIDRLKQVYVVSKDPPKPSQISEDSTKILPQDRRAVDEPEFGYYEPENVAEGRITLRKATEFILRHHEDPVKWSPQVIAKEYKLDLAITQKVLLNFRTCEVWMPSTSDTPVQRSRLLTNKELEITEGKPKLESGDGKTQS